VICINDGSTDNSLEILRNYEKKIRIKIINQTNQGSGVARDKGLEIAKGGYIGFIDSDDWISEDYYEVLYQNAKKSNADISATCQVIFPEKGKKDVGFDGTKFLQTIDAKRKMILTSGVIWNKVYRREFIIKNKICFSSRKSIGEDNIFNIFGAILSNYIVTTDKVNYYWRQRKSSRLSEKKKLRKTCYF
jgi:glycosyltransferase involved in cell wall biosynthesis